MAILNTVTPKEDFLVQMNGDYNVPFDEMEVTVAGVAGEIIAVATGFVILADAKEVEATDAALAEQGIIVVNK